MGYYRYTAEEEALIKSEMEGTGQSREEVISILTAGGYISAPEEVDTKNDKDDKPKPIPSWAIAAGIGVLVLLGGLLVVIAIKK